MARAMVTEYGMSEKLGPVQYEGNHAMFGAQTPQNLFQSVQLMKLMKKFEHC